VWIRCLDGEKTVLWERYIGPLWARVTGTRQHSCSSMPLVPGVALRPREHHEVKETSLLEMNWIQLGTDRFIPFNKPRRMLTLVGT